ncbi:MAG: hypothetical protein ABW321_30865 [Polyangiales bacterium]
MAVGWLGCFIGACGGSDAVQTTQPGSSLTGQGAQVTVGTTAAEGSAGSGAKPAAHPVPAASGAVALPPTAAAGAGSSLPVPLPGSGAPAGNALPEQSAQAGTELPCNVAQLLAANCGKCHGREPAFGAPMSLTSLADLHAPAKTDSSLTVAQASVKRMLADASPMPPGNNILESERQMLVDYLNAGPAPASAQAGACVIKESRSDEYLRAGVTAGPGETCYDFVNHNAQTPGDTSKYSVRAGEHYEQFYFKVPWGPGMVATKFASKLDNIKVAHHWLFYTSSRAVADGSHETTSGTTLGDTATLLAGWAVGGDNVIFPEHMGLELPADGMLNAQWHYYNQGSEPEPDSSAIQVCVVPRAMRQNVAGITFLGTEDFNGLAGMPARTKSDFSGACLNDSGAPITIWGFTPHMHKLGRHMKTVIQRKDGTMETVFDRKFDFDAQITYPLTPPVVLDAGETIKSTCTFDNNTDHNVAFGPSTEQEMCYNFTVSYPLGELDNGVFSLAGALNTCW